MTPFQQARQAMRDSPFLDTWEKDVAAHRIVGRILDTPEFFAMWRHVGLGWPVERLRDPWQVELGSDFVWVWAAAGNWRAAVLAALEVDSAQWIGFDRGGRAKFYGMADIVRRLTIAKCLH